MGRHRNRPLRRTLVAFTGLALATQLLGAIPASAAPAGSGSTSTGSANGAAGWVLSTTNPSAGYSPTFVGNGYLSARVPAAGEGYSNTPIVTQSELAGFYGQGPGSYEQRASLPTWTTLGFGDGTAGGEYGQPGTWACPFDQICPAEYGQISGGAFIETSHANSTVGGYLAGLNTNNQPTVGGADILPVADATAGPATVDIRYSNASGGPQTFTFGVNGVLRQLTVPSLASWDTWAVLSVPVTLVAGGNTLEITIAAGDTGRVNVDYVAAYPSSAGAPTAVAPATTGTVTHYQQSLDMRTGLLTTSFDWTSLADRQTSFTYTVSANRATGHLGTVNLVAVPHWSGTATAVDEFDGQGLDLATAQNPSVDGKHATLSENVATEGDLVTAAMTSVLRVDAKTVPTTALPAGGAGQVASFPVKANHAYQITKYVGVASSADTDRPLTAATPQQSAATTANTAATAGYGQAVSRNDSAWASLWSSDISIPGDSTMTAQIHAATFYLLESMRAGVTWSTSPGGLSSDGYNGHVFWDMETWMYPALLAQYPDIAVGADTYRQKLLPQAEAAAAALSTPSQPIAGAKFPWESALTGNEAIPPGNPEGADEIHIDSDIALAQWQYYETTGDKTWLRDNAWPVLEAIAQYWATRAVPDPSGGYDIDNVQGPDEYHVGVNDSATTNAGAQESLRIAVQAASVLGVPADPAWTTVANGLKIPVDPATDTHPEYDGYSGQTVKQADVTLLQYPWNVPMSTSVAQNDLDYYAQVTDPGGPSMTDAIASIDSSEIGSAGCSAYTYMLRSANPFVAAPFDQFNETRSGGAFIFLIRPQLPNYDASKTEFWQWSEPAGAYYWTRWTGTGTNGEKIHLPQYSWSSSAWPNEASRVVDFWMSTGLDGMVVDAVNWYIGYDWKKNAALVATYRRHSGAKLILPEGGGAFYTDDPTGWILDGGWTALYDYGIDIPWDKKNRPLLQSINEVNPAIYEQSLKSFHDPVVASGGILVAYVLDLKDPGKQQLAEELIATSGDLPCYCGPDAATVHPAPGVPAILKLKAHHPALFQNSLRRRIATNHDESVYVTLRYAADGSEHVLVVFNFSPQLVTVQVDARAINGSRYQDLESEKAQAAPNGKLSLEVPGYGHRIFRVDQ